MDDIGKPPTRIPDGLSGEQLQAWLEGLMYFPDNGPFAMSLFVRRELWAKGPLSWGSRQPITVEERALRALLDGPSAGELEKIMHRREKDGTTAGVILSLVCAMSDAGYPEPSVQKAIFLIEQTSTALTLRDRHVSAPECREAWKLMRPVAHLWAAGVIAPIKWEVAGLDVLLSLAEAFRKFGCSFVPPRTNSHATLLDPQSSLDTGREPAPRTAICLPPDLLKILKRYKTLRSSDL